MESYLVEDEDERLAMEHVARRQRLVEQLERVLQHVLLGRLLDALVERVERHHEDDRVDVLEHGQVPVAVGVRGDDRR